MPQNTFTHVKTTFMVVIRKQFFILSGMIFVLVIQQHNLMVCMDFSLIGYDPKVSHLFAAIILIIDIWKLSFLFFKTKNPSLDLYISEWKLSRWKYHRWMSYLINRIAHTVILNTVYVFGESGVNLLGFHSWLNIMRERTGSPSLLSVLPHPINYSFSLLIRCSTRCMGACYRDSLTR
jgi:hypothetical protein